MQVVWFKRDLRAHDNRALSSAALIGDVLPLFVAEPDLWMQSDMSGRQWDFVMESLDELRTDLKGCGQVLIVRMGSVLDIFQELKKNNSIDALWSHQETGNNWTFNRDKKVAAWCRMHGIKWHELKNNGVQRSIQSRNGWAHSWNKHMEKPIVPLPNLKPQQYYPGFIPTAHDLGLSPDKCEFRQMGGRRNALDRLNTFIETRGRHYRKAMSSPTEGAQSCSRLSPHLAWGTVSVREVSQAVKKRQNEIQRVSTGFTSDWRKSLKSLRSRLHWHCHFIQKLEDEPRLEFQNLHSSYDGIRHLEPNRNHLKAWSNGETGFPFLDACMRQLAATGWLNFRMRAMVMSVASYHLWLHWRAPGIKLARLFTDYEPGIHWSQVQMQAGTTGINLNRIYNPVKQGYDQDRNGDFIRQWIPELAMIPNQYIHEPWLAPNANDVLGKLYPERIIDHISSAQEARKKIWLVRQTGNYWDKATAILEKHGSRKKSKARVKNQNQEDKNKQRSFVFES